MHVICGVSVVVSDFSVIFVKPVFLGAEEVFCEFDDLLSY